MNKCWVVLAAFLPLVASCASTPVVAEGSTTQQAADSRVAASAPGLVVSSPASAAPATSSLPSSVGSAAPSLPSSTLDGAFRVAPPELFGSSGPGAVLQRPCAPRLVTATATTRPVQGGVAGVVRLLGQTCSLHLTAGPTALLDGAGHSLAVPLLALPSVNPPANARSDYPLGEGDALWGFSWVGSWCGEHASTVLIPMTDLALGGSPAHNYGDLHVPITGPEPACDGSSDSTLEPGVAGWDSQDPTTEPSDAVLSPPPAWSDLRLSLAAGPTTGATSVPATGASLINPTGHAVALSPCPNYVVEIFASDKGSEDHSVSTSFEAFPCTAATVVPAHGSMPFTIPGIAFDEGIPHPYQTGSPVTVEVAIAGIPTAKAAALTG